MFDDVSATLGKEFEAYKSKWFQKEEDRQTGALIHVFTGEDWQCKDRGDWSRCPDIYVWPALLVNYRLDGTIIRPPVTSPTMQYILR